MPLCTVRSTLSCVSTHNAVNAARIRAMLAGTTTMPPRAGADAAAVLMGQGGCVWEPPVRRGIMWMQTSTACTGTFSLRWQRLGLCLPLLLGWTIGPVCWQAGHPVKQAPASPPVLLHSVHFC